MEPKKKTGDVTIQVRCKSAEVEVSGGDGGGSNNGGNGGGDKDDKKGGKGDPLGAAVWKAAGGFLTAIGATSGVIVVGAAVLWVRFNELGLPATQAVSVQPKYEPLVQGAQDVILFVLIALAAVLLIFFADQKGRINSITRLLLGGLGLGAILYTLGTDLSAGPKLALIVGVLFLVRGSIVIGRRTDDRFWPLALTVFTSALVFSAACGLLIVQQEKFAQGVAILRGPDDTGLMGVYVTATGDKVYFGQTATIGSGDGASQKRGLFEVKLDDAVTYAVGPLESQDDAAERATRLLEQLLANRERNATSPPAAEQKDNADAGTDKKEGEQVVKEAKPSPVEVVAKGFDSAIVVRRRVTDAPLCLVRYADAANPKLLSNWWTSCEEADQLKTIRETRDVLALPGRFQPAYDMRVRAKVPVGTELIYLEGKVGEQCEHDRPQTPCGRKYAGGGLQFYLPKPGEAQFVRKECTSSGEDAPTVWGTCEG